MTLRLLTVVSVAAAAASLLAGPARSAGPAMTLGAAEDAVRAPDLPSAQAKMAQLRLAGFTAVRITTNWAPGLVAPTADELRELRNVETAADLNGVEVYVSVYNVGQRTTPLEPTAYTLFGPLPHIPASVFVVPVASGNQSVPYQRTIVPLPPAANSGGGAMHADVSNVHSCVHDRPAADGKPKSLHVMLLRLSGVHGPDVFGIPVPQSHGSASATMPSPQKPRHSSTWKRQSSVHVTGPGS